ncbi:MAG: TonB-dependent receptor [Deltaproteobacteria bacterium]|nr:TonB-dependent receptor [Deltaproteobacteria bacterium]
MAAGPAGAAAPERVEAPRGWAEPRGRAVPDVDVLDGETLLRRGVRDLGDALSMLPGVMVLEQADGHRTLVVDGQAGRVALCVDGRTVPRALDGSVDLAELPATVEEVVRVELVRGPMGHVYGNGAEAGVLNVVTRRLQATGASVGASGLLAPGGGAGGTAGAAASWVGDSAGLHGNAEAGLFPGVNTLSARAPPRRLMALGAGGAFRPHARVLLRGDVGARELQVESAGGAWLRRRAQAAGEAIFTIAGGDTLRVELRGAAVESRAELPGRLHTDRAWEQVVQFRYAGEPLADHLLRGELQLFSEWGQGESSAEFTSGRIRVSGMVADTWAVGRVFTLEGALRLESTHASAPVAAPSLSFRYEPFRHVTVRATVGAGYRLLPLEAEVGALPSLLGPVLNGNGAPETGRGARLSVVFQPDALARFHAEVFRTDASDGPLALSLGQGSVGIVFGQFQQAVQPSQHVQGLRLDAALTRLRGGVSASAGYVYLQEAYDDARAARLPAVPRHAFNLVAAVAPEFLGGGVQLALLSGFDRVDSAGAGLPATAVLHLTAWKRLGGVDTSCTVDNALGASAEAGGPRAGRVFRCLVRASL